MRNLTLFSSILSVFVLFSCGNEVKKTEPELEVVTVDTSEKEVYKAAPTEVTFTDPKVADVYQNYINLKTALVNTDAGQTSKEATELMTSLANIGVEEDVLLAANQILDATDVEVQRRAFVAVTTAVEKMIEGKIESGVVYKQYCPMAFDFKGGFWLSNSKEINNPYFGDKMLKCGKVDSEIKQL